MTKKISFFLVMIFLSLQSYAQIGVNTETPNTLTELEITNIINGDGIVPKGIMIPRMTEAQRDAIDISDAANANSLMVYNTDEDCYNYYSKLESVWQSLCGKMGKADFVVQCSTIKVWGEYKDSKELTPSNYISMSVTVKKPGTYSISGTVADPSKNNGYYFTTSGEFLTTGTFSVSVPGMGTPINYTSPNFDNFILSLNGVAANGDDAACMFQVEVKNSAIVPKFVISCSGTKVNGLYYEDVPLDASNTLSVVLTVDPTSFGSTYVLTTNEVDGIKFSGTGTLTSNPQTITLQGEGTPINNTTKRMSIRGNSESSTATCAANVYIVIPPKRILTIGTTSGYGYNFGVVGAASNKMLTDPMNFGTTENSIVRYAGAKNAGTAAGANFWNGRADRGFDITAVYNVNAAGSANNMSTAQLRAALTTGQDGYEKMDIVIIGFNYAMTLEQAVIFSDFLKNGGVLLVFCESSTGNENLLRTIFDKQDIKITAGVAATNPPGSIYRFSDKTDPILQGPFGNVSGTYWGEDATNTLWASNLPLEEVTLYSSNKNLELPASVEERNAATAFRHNTLPFVWVGDGGFNSNHAGTSNTICPFKLKSKVINGVTYPNYPTSKPGYGNATSSYDVYNAMFTANALAWCLNKAEELKREKKQ